MTTTSFIRLLKKHLRMKSHETGVSQITARGMSRRKIHKTELPLKMIRLTATMAVLFYLALGASGAMAGGYGYDIGIKARALGGAFRAIADDWTSVSYNPAGLTYVLDNQFGQANGFGHNRFTYNTNYEFPNSVSSPAQTGYANGQDIPNRNEFAFTPEGGFVLHTPFWGESTFGLTIYQTHDQDLSWNLFKGVEGYSSFDFGTLDNQFKIDLDIVNFQATFSREFIEDKLSVGIGLSVVRADLIYNSITLRDNPLAPDPVLAPRPYEIIPEHTSHDGFGWGLGGKLGLLWKANERLNVAATFTPRTTITVDGRVDFQFFLPENPAGLNLDPTTDEAFLTNGFLLKTGADFKVDIVAPTSFAGGLAYELTDKVRLSLDGEYTLWSQFKGFSFTYDRASFDTLNVTAVTDPPMLTALAQTDLSFPAVWDDAGRVMFGLSYKYQPFLTLLGGFAADQTAATSVTSQPHLVDNGVKYTRSFGLSFTLDRWDMQFVTSYTTQPEITIGAPVDVDGDGAVDNLPASIEGARYMTALGFAYRF